jgi:hypothetical protein
MRRRIPVLSWRPCRGEVIALSRTQEARLREDRQPNPYRCALRALRDEILDFHFSYPLDVVPQAGPKESLSYYLYSDKLSWSVMSMDATGVPRARRRLYGEVYKPAYIAWWGLVNLGHYLHRNLASGLNIFLRQVEWLESHAAIGPRGSVVWPNPYDSLEGDTLLVAPWVSAYDQGMVISALVRGYRITGRPHLMELLRSAHRIFNIDVCDGGVREPVYGGAAYVELPGVAAPGILDGFLTSLLGLYDLFIETDDSQVERLFREGVEGLKSVIRIWDYRHKWSWYSNRTYLCPPSYHILNGKLLKVVAQLTGETVLAEFAGHWSPERLSAMDRLEIYLGFLLTKNWSRMRHQTWRQTQDRVRRLALDAVRQTGPKDLQAGSLAKSSD